MTKTEKRIRGLAQLLVILAAAGVWGFGRMNWVTAEVFDDKSGESTHQLVGAVWDPAGTPLALAMVAALIASLAVPPILRRIIGVLIAVLSAGASFRAVQLIGQEPDLYRAQQLLSSGVATQNSSNPEQISAWAQVLYAEVHNLPVILTVIVAVLGVCGGVILAMKPGTSDRGYSRYETPERRREGAKEDLSENPDSGRVLWDALDAGVDPTDEDRK